jgi:siroheme synthase
MKYLIFGDFFKLFPTHGIYDAESLRTISGGGVLDGNGLAEIEAAMRRGLRSQIIKGVTKAGILTAYDPEEIEHRYVSGIVIMNNLSLKNTIGIWNNRCDCTFSKIEIINF